jgi:hypothetical protein
MQSQYVRPCADLRRPELPGKGRGVCMKRTIGAIVVLFILGGLFRAYRDGRLPMIRTETRASAMSGGDGLTDPPNWKVEPADRTLTGRPRTQLGRRTRAPVATISRYGVVDPSPPPFWGRRNLKFPPTAPANISQDSSREPQRATSPNGGQQPVAKAAVGPSLVAFPGRTGTGPVEVVDQEHRDLLHHAQFLIKAGLAPVAKQPLQQILREAPGTPIAREARLTLDTIQN